MLSCVVVYDVAGVGVQMLQYAAEVICFFQYINIVVVENIVVVVKVEELCSKHLQGMRLGW